MYNVTIIKDTTPGPWKRVYNTHYTVRDALLYDNININVRLPESNIDNIFTFKGKVPDINALLLRVDMMIFCSST